MTLRHRRWRGCSPPFAYGGEVTASRRARVLPVVGAVLAGALALAACGGEAAPASSAATTADSPTPAPSASAPSPSAPPVHPFTGGPATPLRPVLVIKIDNTGAAQPHAGVRAADIVYIEEVEWGLTRLAAVYSSTLPEVAGPVRSARISDIDILAAFGQPAFAYSGAQTRLRPVLAAADFFDVSGEQDGAGYFRVDDRPAPVNYLVRPADLLERAPQASVARDIGLTFDATAPAGGRPAQRAKVEWPASTVEFRWTGAAYDVWFDGREAQAVEGGGQQAATVVLQFVTQTDSGYGDRYGGRTPLVETVGSGTALVLRDGRAFEARWERATPAEGTRFTRPNGDPMPFAPGQQWIVLVDRERGAQVD